MNRCLCCGRRLTNEVSVALHIGPECRAGLRKSRQDRAAEVSVCLEESRHKVEEFLARARDYLTEGSFAALSRSAAELIGRLRRYPQDLRGDQRWASASLNLRRASEAVEQGIEQLASLAGRLASQPGRDWRTDSGAWAAVLGALDSACGYGLVRSGVHRRLARLHRMPVKAAPVRPVSSQPSLLSLLEPEASGPRAAGEEQEEGAPCPLSSSTLEPEAPSSGKEAPTLWL